MGVELPKASTHLKLLEKLQELFPEMVEGVQWNLTEGGFRNVLDFLASIRVAELAKILDDENLMVHWEIDYRKIIGIYRNFDGKLLHSYFTTVSEVVLELIAPLRPFQRCFGS